MSKKRKGERKKKRRPGGRPPAPPPPRRAKRGLWLAGFGAVVVAGIALVTVPLLSGNDTQDEPRPAEGPPHFGFEVVASFPHDPHAFTQGLVFFEGRLFEGTGQYGSSELREVELETGKVVKSIRLDASRFGEGVTLLGDRLYQLTWRSRIGYVYERATLRKIREFGYEGEGWGLTHDGSQLILSDGTSTLRFLDPETFEVKRRVTVQDRGRPVRELNELEFVDGEIYANVWTTDTIARISPKDGRILGWIDLRGLLPDSERTTDDVLNGIAWDPEKRRLFVTGKNWPKLFEIRLVPRKG